jgi:PAS domain S-box-containing protein
MEVKVGNEVYLVVFHPLPEQECVNVSGFDISDQKESKERVLETEEKYLTLFNSIDEGFYIIDVIFDEDDNPVDLFYVESNETANRMLGMDYTGKRLREIDPNYESYWYEIFGKVAKTGQSVRMEQYAEPDKKWYSFYLFKIGGPNSRRIGNIFQDITNQKKSEAAIKESEQLYKTLFENTEDGFVLIEPIFDEAGNSNDYVMLNVNRSWEHQTGLKADEFLGKRISTVLPELEPIWPSIFGDVAKKSKSTHFESYNHNSNKWYDVHAFPYQQGLVGVLFKDITERKKAEEALKESKERFRGIVETTNEGIAIHEPDGTITYVNQRMVEMLGYSHEEIIGRLSLDFIDEEERKKVTQARESLREQGSFCKERKMRRKDGSILWTLSNVTVRKDGAGNYIGYLAMHTDITERKRAEDALLKARDELVDFRRRLNEILESIADDLYVLDRDYKFTFINPRTASKLGKKPEDLLGNVFWDVFPRNLGTITEENYRAAMDKREIRRFEIYGPYTKRWYQETVFPSAEGITCLGPDITERKQVEEALRETSEREAYLLRLSDLIRPLEKAEDIQTAGTNLLADYLKTARVNYVEWHEEDDIVNIRSQAYGNEIPDRILNHVPSKYSYSVEKFYSEQAFIFSDIEAIPLMGPEEKQLFLNRGIRSQLGVAIKRDQKIVVTLAAQQLTPREWTSAEIALVKETAERMYEFIERARERLKLKQSEERFRAVQENSLDRFTILKPCYDDQGEIIDFTYVWQNARAAMTVGHRPEYLIGRRMSEIFPAALQTRFVKMFKRAVETGQATEFEDHYQAHGVDDWFFVRVTPIPDGIAIATQIITERKQAEERIRQRAEELATVMEMAPVAIWVGHDPQSNSITGNRMANEFYEVEKGENVSANVTPVRRFFHKGIELNADELPMQEAALNDMDIRNLELDVLLQSGKWRFMLGSASPLHDADGNVRGSVGAFIDITERKQAEKELQESEARFKNLFEVISSGVAVYDIIDDGRDFIFKAMNPAGELIDHVRQEDIIGKSLYESFPNVGEMGLDAALRRVWQTGKREFLPVTLYEDNNIALWVTNYIYKLSSGELVAVFEDITERKKAEEERERLLGQIQQEKDRLSSLVNSITDEVWFADTQKNFILVNPSGSTELGATNKRDIGVEELATSFEIYRPDGSLRPIDDAPLLRALRGEVLKNHDEIIRTPVHGELRYRQVSASPVRDIRGNIIGSVSVVRDTTELKEAEIALQKAHGSLEEKVKERTAELEEALISLKEKEESLSEAQKMAHIGNWDLDIVTGEVYWSDELFHIFKCNPKEFAVTYDKILNFIHPEDRDSVVDSINEAFKEKTCTFDYRIILTDEEERIVHTYVEVIFNDENTPIRIKGTVQDITEHKKAETALQESEMRLRQFYDSGMLGVFYYNVDGSITDGNDKFLEIIGYTREDLQAGLIQWNKMTPPEYRSLDEYAIAEMKAKGVATPYEKEFIRKDGSRIPIFIGAATTIDEAHIRGVAFVLDITERKEAEEALARIEIVRKQEIHHRIKNNLQVISSLLDLQAETFRDQECIEDSEVLKAFRESQNRVTSMALIHEELYKGGGFETLNFSPYIEKLVESLFQTYNIGNIDISLNMDLVEDAFFDMDIAIPLGIIVNELVSNSFKHAFKGRDRGEIRIRLHREESEDCESVNFILTVSDNGVGIPENFEIEDLDSLGMQLVTTLVDQLDGELELKKNNGTEFTMKFAVIKKNDQATAPVLQQSI